MKEFYDLPFNERPDLTPYLIHLTKDFKKLKSILKNGEIKANKKCIKGDQPAVCFMDIPFYSLKHIINKDNEDRYGPYGIIVTKKYAYKKKVRPVLYLSDEETDALNISEKELWRVVRFEVQKKAHEEPTWISWLHEREWRCCGDFSLPKELIGVLVKTSKEAQKLQKKMKNKSWTRSIIPLSVICQGLIY